MNFNTREKLPWTRIDKMHKNMAKPYGTGGTEFFEICNSSICIQSCRGSVKKERYFLDKIHLVYSVEKHD